MSIVLKKSNPHPTPGQQAYWPHFVIVYEALALIVTQLHQNMPVVQIIMDLKW